MTFIGVRNCKRVGSLLTIMQWEKLTGDFIRYAAKAVLNLAKDAGIERLFSFTAKINASSERVMQKVGMEKAGEFNHPKLSNDSPLCIHVLYKIDL